ncbi:MAG: type II CAAX endopeptidase family protein [Bacteroidales bacterium]|nr:type II CAAX endopeptidase family protein [Bacteroidales bacterium]
MKQQPKYFQKGDQLWMITLFAVVLFVLMFIFKQLGSFDFWYWMSTNLIVLLTLVFISDRDNLSEIRGDLARNPLRKVFIGLLAAIVLFVVFYAGNIFIRILFEKAGEGIQNVYAFKQEASPLRIALLMLLVIGPGEELFWRGYLQRRLGMKYGPMAGFVIASLLYTIVHIATGNSVLVLAAFVCGVFWGWLYMKYRSMLINVVSHTVWDIGVFILLPFAA